MARELEYDLVNNATGESLGRVWWDTSRNQIAGDGVALGVIQNGSSATIESRSDLASLGRTMRSGYISAKRVK
jgi:hypothetical protein